MFCDAHRAEQRIAAADRVASLVAQQMLDGYFFDPFVPYIPKQRIVQDAVGAEDPVAERKPSLFAEFHDAGRRDQLGEGCDPEDMPDVGTDALFFVCPAESLAV